MGKLWLVCILIFLLAIVSVSAETLENFQTGATDTIGARQDCGGLWFRINQTVNITKVCLVDGVDANVIYLQNKSDSYAILANWTVTDGCADITSTPFRLSNPTVPYTYADYAICAAKLGAVAYNAVFTCGGGSSACDFGTSYLTFINVTTARVACYGGATGIACDNDDSNKVWNIANITLFGAAVNYAPIWTNYTQNATSIIQNRPIYLTANFSDTDAVHGMNVSTEYLYINFSNGTAHSYYDTNVLGDDCTGSPYSACYLYYAFINTTIAGDYIWSYSISDTFPLTNSTPWRNFTITADAYPQWYNISQNATSSYGNLYAAINWTDDNTMALSSFIFSLNNVTDGTGWKNISVGSTTVTYYTGTTYGLYAAKPILNPGNYTWKIYLNDSYGNQNVTTTLNHLVLDDANPEPYGYAQNASSVALGHSILLSGNFTDDIELSGFYLAELLPTGVWYNTTWSSTWTSCAAINNCYIEIAGVPNPTGTHNWSIFVNDSVNQWNNTAWETFLVTSAYPEYVNYTQNDTSIRAYGGEVEITINWTSPAYPLANMSHAWLVVNNASNHTIINTSNGGSLNCGGTGQKQNCGIIIDGFGFDSYADINGNGTGQYWWREYANVSIDGAINSTPWRPFTVEALVPNSTANLSYWKTNPCIDKGAIKLNEIMNISMRIDDADGNVVTGRIILYGDNATYLNDTGWQGSGGAGTWFNNGTLWNYTFPLSYVLSNTTIIMSVKDYVNGTAINTTQTFSVGTSGFINGECFTDSTTIPTTDPGAPASNALGDLFNDFLNGLSLPLVIFWLIIMAIAVIVVWVKMHSEALLAGIVSIAIVVLWSFLGFKLEILSGALFGLIIVLLVAVIGIVIWSKVKNG